MQPFFEKREFTRDKPLTAGFSGGLGFLAHWHQDFEMVCMLEGVQGMSVNNCHRVLRPGDIALCGSRDVHYYDGAPGQGRFVMLIVDAAFLRDQAGWSDRFVLGSPFLTLPEAEPLFVRIAQEGQACRPYHEVAMKAAMLDIATLLLRSGHLREEPDHASIPSDPSLSKVQEALRLLETDFAEDLTHDQLAMRLGISPTYFSRIFNRATGMGFREYLNHLRVRRAEDMLSGPEGTVTDIAFACGFGSLRSFHRAFRDIAGKTPLEARKGHS